MKKILIAAHGHFASGVKSTLELIFGEQDHIAAIDCYVDDEQPKDKIQRYLNTLDEKDELMICTDIPGGSVNQLMVPYLSRPGTFLVSGINVAFMAELALSPAMPDKEDLKEMMERAKSQLIFVNETLSAEEDFDL